ncbi:MAG: hypothetical protein PQJ60_09645, partial [Spirochaetales bacterium]|nr:hypothetical protein [Spirochaetales bacterium]
ESIRFAVAPGFAVPLDSYDAEEEYEAYAAGDEYRLQSASTTDSLGLGLRLYFDYIVTEDFYINLYNQTKYYLPNSKTNDFNSTEYVSYLFGTSPSEYEYEYPLYFDFELDFNYDLRLTPKTKFGFGLPVKYSMAGETTIEGTGQEDDYYSLAIAPSLSFFTAESIPFEIVLDYYMTLAGKNTTKNNYLGVQIKLFYDFY